MKNKMDVYQQVTDQVLGLMESEGSNWTRPWAAGSQHNPQTGTHYRGINVLLLGIAKHKNGFASDAWSTFKGWQAMGGKIVKGSKATHIIFYKVFEKTTPQANGLDLIENFPVLRSYCVFNHDQVTDVELPKVEIGNGEQIKSVDSYIESLGANVKFGGDRACYIPSLDQINMPELNTFRGLPTSTATESFYSTFFHELTHWTKTDARCRRGQSKGFGSESYAAEELVAELGAAFQCAKHGISSAPRADHAKYLNGWIKELKDNKRAIFKASTAAQKAVDFMDAQQTERALAA